jgi:rhodanese-related sulfurtransferase
MKKLNSDRPSQTINCLEIMTHSNSDRHNLSITFCCLFNQVMHEIKRSPITIKILYRKIMMFKKLIQTILLGCTIILCLFFGIAHSQSESATLPASSNLQLGIDRFLSSIPSGYYTISTVEELKNVIDNSQPLLVDVRESSEYQSGYIPSAISIPLRTLAQNLDQIPSDRPVILYCSTGYRSALGVMTLQLLGYENVRGFPLSFVGWKDAGEKIAASNIRELQERSGQMVYQARQTLKDQHGNNWQAIAFKRIRNDGKTSFFLRLVGFPNVAEIDRSQPLTLTNSLGEILTATDSSNYIFTDTFEPQPNVGQYNLQPVLSQLQAEIPLKLSLPIIGDEAISLSVPPSFVEEWQTVGNYKSP